MPTRSLRFRGFGLTLEVPERLTRLLRGRRSSDRAPSGPVLLSPPPEVIVEPRRRELRHWREFAAANSQFRPEPGVDDPQAVAAHSWYHTIELADGSVTPGRFDHRQLLPFYGLPDDLHGKRALDVGSGDGFWVFELERRGADVTSLDVETFADVDLPAALHEVFVDRPVNLSFRRGVEIARRRVASQVKLINKPVYELDPEEVGTFDFVHAGDILLHLRDPALALQRIRAVTAGEALFADGFDPTLDAAGAGEGLTRYSGGWDDVIWWAPALSTLTQMVRDAGFDDVRVVTTYQLGERGNLPGLWRAVIRARTDASQPASPGHS